MMFETTHKLDFEVAPWTKDKDWLQFRVGTCHGLWSSTDTYYDILAVNNEEPGNGHFDDVLEWFENSCRRDNKDLQISEVWNEPLKLHLIAEHGFEEIDRFNIIKKFRDGKTH